jgi:hypothetical protein
LTNETKGVITVSTGVIDTLTALVVGQLIGAASSSFNIIPRIKRLFL